MTARTDCVKQHQVPDPSCFSSAANALAMEGPLTYTPMLAAALDMEPDAITCAAVVNRGFGLCYITWPTVAETYQTCLFLLVLTIHFSPVSLHPCPPRLHRGGEPQSERHRREEGRQSSSACRAGFLPKPSGLQTHGR